MIAAVRMCALAAVLMWGAGADAPAYQLKTASKVFQISIDRASFGEAPARLEVGDVIEWVNSDIFDHTVTAKNGAWDVVIPAGKKARVAMKKMGVFEYFCKFHPNMSSAITVRKTTRRA